MEPVYTAANALGRGVLRVLGVDVRGRGAEQIPRVGPVILASTHGSYLDFVVLQKAALGRGRNLRFLIRHDAWRPPVGYALDRMRHVPVDRAAPAGAYLAARDLLRRGEALGVFPEAGLSYSYTVRPLMRGVAALARETGAPVLPVAIWGAQRIATVGDPHPWPDLTRGRVVDARIGDPDTVAPGTDLTSWTWSLGERLTALLEDLQRQPRHRPRPGEYAAWYPAHLGGAAPCPDRARALEQVPASAVRPTWGPAAVAPPGPASAPESAACDRSRSAG